MIFLTSPKPLISLGLSELEVNEETQDMSYSKCYCDSCNFNFKFKRFLTINMFVGVLLPLVWLFNIFVIILGCYWLPHSEVRYDEYVQAHDQKFASRKILKIPPLNLNGEVCESIIAYHGILRRKTKNLALYSLGCFIIYSMFVGLLVYGIMHPPVVVHRPL